MTASTLAATAMPTLAVLLLTGSVLAAVVGLCLGAGRRARGRLRAAPPQARGAVWTAIAPPRPSDPDPEPDDCDWVLWWDAGDGHRLVLRHPVGRACCHYVVGVRELAPRVSLDEREEAFGWTGGRTHIGAGGATTPTTRDVVARRASGHDGGLGVGVSLERTPGPTVTTPPWRRVAGRDEAAAGIPGTAAARLWASHVDDLRDRGIRPVPEEGPGVATEPLRRRIEVVLRAVPGCPTTPAAATVDARVHARLTGTADPGAARMAAPTLASWVSVDGHVVAADVPTAAPTGLASWSRVTTDDDAGIEAATVPSGGTCEAGWSGRWEGEVDASAIRLVAGSAVALAIDGAGDGAVPAAARLDATTSAQVRIEVGPAAGHPVTSGCARCLPGLVVQVAHEDDTGAGADPAGSTSQGTIGLDGRVLRLYAPAPGSDHGSWTVAGGEVAEGAPVFDDADEVR